MEKFSALLAACDGNNRWVALTLASDTVFGVFFDLLVNKRLSK